MCFDKTGTLTEDGLDLLGVRPVFYDKNEISDKNKLSFAKLIKDMVKLTPNIDPILRIYELQNYINTEKEKSKDKTVYSKKQFPCEQLLEIMATCHSLTFINDAMIGDPLDVKMFEATKWILEENHKQKFGETVIARVRSSTPPTRNRSDSSPTNRKTNEPILNRKDIGIIRKFEFSSKLQRMSVVVQDLLDQDFKVHIKGSPEKIRELCRRESVPENFHYILEKYTEQGYRVLVCASRVLNTDLQTIMTSKREELEKDFTMIGFLIMENRLKPVTTDVIDTLHAAEIRTIMVTGDNVLTAISIARQCQIVAASQRIFLGDFTETKGGKQKVVWKDFEFSASKLNPDLELELDYENRILLPPIKNSRNGSLNTKSIEEESEQISKQKNIKNNLFDDMLDNTCKSQHLSIGSINETKIDGKSKENSKNGSILIDSPETDFDIQLIDFDPPFFALQDHEDYCIAVTGIHIYQK